MSYENCKVARYHEMRVISSPYKGDITTAQQERCNKCGEVKAYTFLPDGSMRDSRQYFLDHIRYFAQPVKEDKAMLDAFLFCNPGAAKRLEEAEKQNKRHEWFQQEMNEKFRWAIKRAMENQGWKDKGAVDGLNRSSSEK